MVLIVQLFYNSIYSINTKNTRGYKISDFILNPTTESFSLRRHLKNHTRKQENFFKIVYKMFI